VVSKKDPQVGVNLRFAIEHAAEMIRLMPGTWPVYVSGTRRFLVVGFSYSLIYKKTAALSK